MAVLCVFGDSTGLGVWDSEKGGWANRLWLFLGEIFDIDFYNLSICGGTTNTILVRFETEARIRKADMFIFQSGGNDAACDGKGNYQVAPDQFKNNTEEIIKRAKKITEKIIFIGSEIVDEQKTNPAPWGETYYMNENIKKYNEIMKKVCSRQNVLFLDTFDLLNNNDLDDGLHPNVEGHRKMFEKIKNFIIENKFIEL